MHPTWTQSSRGIDAPPPSHERAQSERNDRVNIIRHWFHLRGNNRSRGNNVLLHKVGALDSSMIRSLLPILLAGAAFGSVSDDLQRFEGFSATSYVCTAGHLTVGFGHRTAKSVTMSRETALAALADDIAKAEHGARLVFPTFSSQPQHVQDVLVETVFQLGASGMRKFIKFGQAIHDRDYALASASLINSRFHKQCKQRCETIARKLINP